MIVLEVLIAAILAVASPASSTRSADRSDLVGFVGDSVTSLRSSQLLTLLDECGAPPVAMDAVAGRRTLVSFNDPVRGSVPSGVGAIAAIEQSADPDVWVVQLGANDVAWNDVQTTADAWRLIDSVLALVDATDEVFWVNTFSVFSPVQATMLNAALAADDRITVLDWASAAPSNTIDGVHPNARGVERLAGLYCTALASP